MFRFAKGQPQWKKKFSNEYLQKAIKQLIAKAKQDQTREETEQRFDEFVTRLNDFGMEQIVVLPLFGIELAEEVDNLVLGKITLKRTTSEYIENLRSKTMEIFHVSPNTLETKEMLQAELEATLAQLTEWGTCAEFRIVAESDLATDQAEIESRRVMDILQYYVTGTNSSGLIVRVGLVGEVAYELRRTYIVSADISQGQLSARRKPTAPNYKLFLDNNQIEQMEKDGIFALSNILQSDKVTQFEETLLSALHWYAISQKQDDPENELLNLTICLETFFTPEKPDPISLSIAEGVAFIIGTNLQDRKELKKRIKHIYNQRSRVSHGGIAKIQESDDLASLRADAKAVLQNLIARKDTITSKQDLFDWIEDQKLS